jgi:hypothetical protein
LIISFGVFWLARSSSIFANLKPGNSNGDTVASSQHQVAEPDQLPRHPFEHMGIAYLTPSTSMPDTAVTEAHAIDIVTEYIWGAYQDELVKNYPPSAVPAVYDAGESVMDQLQRSCPYGWSFWKVGDHPPSVPPPVHQVQKIQRLGAPPSLHLKMSAYPARVIPMLLSTPHRAKSLPAGTTPGILDQSVLEVKAARAGQEVKETTQAARAARQGPVQATGSGSTPGMNITLIPMHLRDAIKW